MIARMLSRSVTIERRGQISTDALGSPITGTTSTVTTTGHLNQVESDETLGPQDTAEAEFRLFLPAGTSIDHSDRVVIDSSTYEVVSVPASRRRATSGTEHHVEVRVREVVG